jgi:excisionase family DNA binding protein
MLFRPRQRMVHVMTDIPSPETPDRPLPPWLDAEEVAPHLCTTAHTMRRLAREGHSPVVVRRIGGRWRFSRLDLERFMTSAAGPPATSPSPNLRDGEAGQEDRREGRGPLWGGPHGAAS